MKKSTNNLHESMKIMKIINNIFGLRFFEFPPGHLRICWSVFYIAVLWIGWAFYISTSIDSSFKAINTYFISLDLLVYVPMTLLGLYYSKSYAIFNQKLKNTDESVRKLGVPHNRREIYNTYIIFIVWLLPSLISIGHELNWWLMNRNKPIPFGLFLIFFNAYPLLLTSFVFLDFTICVRNMKNGFEKVNYLLEGLNAEYDLENLDDKKINRFKAGVFQRKMPIRTDAWARSNNFVIPESHFPTSVSSEEVLERDEKMKILLHLSRLIHLELTTASKILFMMFNVQLTILLQVGLLPLAHKITLICELDSTDMVWPYALPVISEVFNLFFYCFKIAWICYFCENATQEGHKTLELIHTYSKAEGIDSQTLDEIQQFSLQITQMNYGCARLNSYFQMDYNFLSEYILLITTYVLLMKETNRIEGEQSL